MRGYAAIGMYAPKTEANLGGVLRACGCYEASMVAIEGHRYRKLTTDTQKAYRHIPLLHGSLLELIPFDCVPVVVELREDAVSLVDYVHPRSAFYIFGPEDGDVPERIAAKCRDRVYIPTNFCMNLAATVNVVLYDRMAKQRVNGEGSL